MTDNDKYFISLACNVALASKCVRAQYGSVLVRKDGTIASTGYNGKPRGSINDHICYREGLIANSKEAPNCCLHSEVNCIMFANPIDRIGATLYVNGKPCIDCLLVIMQSGINRVVYLDEPNPLTGHVGNSSKEFLEKYGFENKIEFVPIKL